MSLLWTLLSMALFFSVIFSSDQWSQRESLSHAEIDAVAESLMIYRNSVSLYAKNNPAMVGTVTDLALGMPVWYVKHPGTDNYVVTGSSYVYYTKSLPGLVGALADKTESLSVGTNYSGVLHSPNSGSAIVPIPAPVPNMAVVIVQ